VPPSGQDYSAAMIVKLFNEGQGNKEAVSSGTAVTISDPSVFSITALTLSGAAPVITLPAPRAGAIKRLYLIQDATGSRIPSWVTPGGATRWVGAAAPTLQTAAGSVDRVTFECYDGVNWVGAPALHIA
jgi:hypothetical protein